MHAMPHAKNFLYMLRLRACAHCMKTMIIIYTEAEWGTFCKIPQGPALRYIGVTYCSICSEYPIGMWACWMQWTMRDAGSCGRLQNFAECRTLR